MRASNNSLFQTNPLVWLYAIAIISVILYDLTPSFNTFDTPYFIMAGENLLNLVGFDCLRTPVYPLFVMFCRRIGGPEGMDWVITVFQSILFLVSVYSLYDTCKRVLKRSFLSFVITVYYIIIPAAGWANEILTESFSVSLCVVLTHWIICFVQKPNWRLNVAIPVLLSLMVLMRPNFIAFFAILPILWIYQWFKTRERGYLFALLFCLVPIGGYLGYCKAYEQQYGMFNSNCSVICCRYYNLNSCAPENVRWDEFVPNDDKEELFVSRIVAARDSGNPTYGPVYDYIAETGDTITVLNVLDRMESSYKDELLRYRIRLVTTSSFDFMMPWMYRHGGLSSLIWQFCHFIALPVSLLYFVVVAFAIAMLVVFTRKKHIPVIAVTFWAIIAAQVVGISISGSDSFDRLLMPVLPMALVLLGIGVESMLSERDRRNEGA